MAQNSKSYFPSLWSSKQDKERLPEIDPERGADLRFEFWVRDEIS